MKKYVSFNAFSFLACNQYTLLTDSWRKITGFGPSSGKGKYHCDSPRLGSRGIKEGWHRFSGEAGTYLPTEQLNTGMQSKARFIYYEQRLHRIDCCDICL